MTLVLEKYWMCPCDSSWGSQGYSSSHKALDFGWLTKYGANLPVKACKSGMVVDAGQITETINGKKYYPTVVVIMHPDVDCVWITRYWHLVKDSCKVKIGDTVMQGQVIGTRGNTGYSKGVHLHLEIWKAPLNYKYKASDYSKYAQNPLNYLYLFDGQVFNQSGAFKLVRKPTEISKPRPVEKDELKHQVEVIADELRIRETPSLNGEQLFICDKGIYNVIQSKETDGYIWCEIETNRWIATKEGVWTIDNPIVTCASEEGMVAVMKQQIDKWNNDLSEVIDIVEAIKKGMNEYEG